MKPWTLPLLATLTGCALHPVEQPKVPAMPAVPQATVTTELWQAPRVICHRDGRPTWPAASEPASLTALMPATSLSRERLRWCADVAQRSVFLPAPGGPGDPGRDAFFQRVATCLKEQGEDVDPGRMEIRPGYTRCS